MPERKNESITTAETLRKLAEALDVDVDDILGIKLNDAVYYSIREKRILDNYRRLNQERMDIMEALMELAVQAVEASESVPQTSAAHTSQSTSGTNPAQEGLKTGWSYTKIQSLIPKILFLIPMTPFRKQIVSADPDNPVLLHPPPSRDGAGWEGLGVGEVFNPARMIPELSGTYFCVSDSSKATVT